MYRGNLVELGTTAQIMKNPQHVYTKRLLNSMPIIDPVRARKMFEEFEVSAEEISNNWYRKNSKKLKKDTLC